MSLPKHTSLYLVDNHGTKVAELRAWVRTVKILGLGLLFPILVNFVLMYGLIKYPCTPSSSRCETYCAGQNPSHFLGLPTPVEHPILFSTPIMPASTEVNLYPEASRSTDLAVRPSAEIGRRQLKWWHMAMLAYYSVNQVVSWYSMVDACRDFSGVSNVLSCVWGAISSAITAAGALWATGKAIGKLSTFMDNNGIHIGNWKREIDANMMSEIQSTLPWPVTHLGTFDYSSLGLDGTLAKRASNDPLHVFGLTLPSGQHLHFSYLGPVAAHEGSDQKHDAFKFGFGSGVVPQVTGRSLFDQQYFTSGGIDFILFENAADGSQLIPELDYKQMEHEVSCYMNAGNNAAGHYFQVYDDTHKNTIAEGAVAPFRASDHWSAIQKMGVIPAPILPRTACE